MVSQLTNEIASFNVKILKSIKARAPAKATTVLLTFSVIMAA
jgi:hypothetical protein